MRVYSLNEIQVFVPAGAHDVRESGRQVAGLHDHRDLLNDKGHASAMIDLASNLLKIAFEITTWNERTGEGFLPL